LKSTERQCTQNAEPQNVLVLELLVRIVGIAG
jgi:hypothetical protein